MGRVFRRKGYVASLRHLEEILGRFLAQDTDLWGFVEEGPRNTVLLEDLREAVCDLRRLRAGRETRREEVAGYVAGLRRLCSTGSTSGNSWSTDSYTRKL